MGMFTKDEYFKYGRMEDFNPQNVPFIIYGIEVVEGFPLPEGSDNETCEQARITVAHVDKPTEAVIVSTLSGPICKNGKLAEASDFPNLVIWKKVPSGDKVPGNVDATVLQTAAVPDAELEKIQKLDPKKITIGVGAPAEG